MKPTSFAIMLSVVAAAGCAVDELETVGEARSRGQVSNQVVIDWNDYADLAIETAAQSPPRRARAFAIVAVAVHDALNGVEQRFTRYASTADDGAASPEAAAAQAAHDALVALFPAQQADLDAKLASSLAALRVDKREKRRGIALGRAAASAVLAAREDDGSATIVTYTPTLVPGSWRPTPDAFLPALEPNWGNVVPFGLASGSQFRAPAPYALDSAEYAADVNEIQSVGSATSTTRTADETSYALFWYEPSANGWNRLARAALALEPKNIYTTGRLFALMNAALNDGYIASFNDKYFYNFWRPITAIREANSDGNPATVQDETWTPLRPTPPMSDHTSGHAVVGAAAAVALEEVFGDDVGAPITMTSRTATPAGTTRSWDTFAQAVAENADSRVKVGIHFRKACDDGLAQGSAIGEYIVDTLFVREHDGHGHHGHHDHGHGYHGGHGHHGHGHGHGSHGHGNHGDDW